MNDGASKLSVYIGSIYDLSTFKKFNQNASQNSSTLSLLRSVEAVRERPLRRLILDARVPIFEMFHQSPNTAGAHAHISVCTLKPEKKRNFTCGYVNSQNFRYWSSEKSNLLHGKPLHDQKLGVQYAFTDTTGNPGNAYEVLILQSEISEIADDIHVVRAVYDFFVRLRIQQRTGFHSKTLLVFILVSLTFEL
ncbi:hypothetical protein ANN_23479 [Periplaneta americana]|uniref:Uncharacterized protein n=1 Tax=Periplaneta americana TaxID=6978 RepID=A0ABQ8SL95_PERAM|nr:hypothetical protein ANN_23479 [Periplaneta americana]